MKGVIIIDVNNSLACKCCELECAGAHLKTKELFTAINENPPPSSKVTVESNDGISALLQCRHCEDAHCITIYPKNVLEKKDRDYPVFVLEDRCIGCKMCIIACPFGVISLDNTGKVITKCELCIERNERPACVTVCPVKAIKFVPIDTFLKEKRKKAAKDFLVEVKKSRFDSDDSNTIKSCNTTGKSKKWFNYGNAIAPKQLISFIKDKIDLPEEILNLCVN